VGKSTTSFCTMSHNASLSLCATPQGPTSWTGRGYFPSFPATSPYVTAVGATMGPESGTEEIACQSQLGGVITTGMYQCCLLCFVLYNVFVKSVNHLCSRFAMCATSTTHHTLPSLSHTLSHTFTHSHTTSAHTLLHRRRVQHLQPHAILAAVHSGQLLCLSQYSADPHQWV